MAVIEVSFEGWKIICEGDAVSILGDTGDSKVGLIGSGRWSGKGLAQRYAAGDPIDDSTWARIENALRRAFAEPAATSALRSPATVDPAEGGSTGRAAPMPRSAASGAAGESATAEEAPPSTRPEDRRSGWWAFAAAGVALVGTIVSWRTMPPGDNVALGVTIALAAVTVGLAIYGGVGLGTRCPSCRAWYRRETTSTDVLDTSTYSKQITTPVNDSSGKQIGTTSETATYERTSYRYHYRCKVCAHRWTGTGSSERRIS